VNRSPWAWPAIIIISNVSIGLLVFGEFLPPVRHLMSFWFLLVCPGMAYVPLLHVRDGPVEWTLAIALSLAIDAIVATFMVYTGNWSPNGGLIALMAISIGGVALQITVMGLPKGASPLQPGKGS
jgi:hypothetical protein